MQGNHDGGYSTLFSSLILLLSLSLITSGFCIPSMYFFSVVRLVTWRLMLHHIRCFQIYSGFNSGAQQVLITLDQSTRHKRGREIKEFN